VLTHDVVSHHSTPDIGSRYPWTPKHLSNPSVLPHLYTMTDLNHAYWLTLKIACLRRSEAQVLGNVVVLSMVRQCAGLCSDG
jgi:hypothetical protein